MIMLKQQPRSFHLKSRALLITHVVLFCSSVSSERILPFLLMKQVLLNLTFLFFFFFLSLKTWAENDLTNNSCQLFYEQGWHTSRHPISEMHIVEGKVLRWWRNRMGRPLSPPQIHQKNISTLNKLYKTTSECWQRTSGTQKSRSLSSKTG